MKIVIWKDGTYLKVKDGVTWEYENDKNWLVTIDKQTSLEKSAEIGWFVAMYIWAVIMFFLAYTLIVGI